jgi:hypothetical protein
MPITVREDQTEAGGFALVDLGQTVDADPIRLSFRRQDAEPRDLGAEGWQPEAAWHTAEPIGGGGPTTVVRIGPTIVDWIDELVPVEIAVEGVGLLGTVVWPQLTRSPRPLTDTRIRMARTAPPAVPPPPKPPPRTTEPVVPPAPPALVERHAPAAVGIPRKPRRLWPIAAVALLPLVVAAAAAPLVALRMGSYDLVVESHEPLDFVETRSGATSRLAPTGVTIEVRRAKWASYFEGWWLKEPPPVEPVIGKDGAWLTAKGERAGADAVAFAFSPDPKAFPSGNPSLRTTVAFRNTASGTSTNTQNATLRRAPGKLVIDQPAGATYRGRQGGPFAPPQFTFNISAQGLGFHWHLEATPPPWLEVTPLEGDLRDDSAMPVVLRLRPAAQALAPGNYEAQLIVKDAHSGEVIERTVRVVVDPKLEPPPGRLVVELPNPLNFAGVQGGPIAPAKITFRVKAIGTGFKWTSEGAPAWLELAPAQGELRDNENAELSVQTRPAAKSLSPGTYETHLVFKKVGSGDIITEPVRLVVGVPSGRLNIDAPTPLVFSGPQGGPFNPPRVALSLKASGNGFKWTAEGTPPWLELTPFQGELRDNGSVEVTARLRPGAQMLTPGTYEVPIAFKKTGPDQTVTQSVRVLVSLSFR